MEGEEKIMKKICYIFLVLFLISCGTNKTADIATDTKSGTAGIQPLENPDTDSGAYREGELLVKFKTGVPITSSSLTHQAVGSTVKKRAAIVPGLEHITLPEDISVSDAIELYMSDPNVEYAEPNYLRQLDSSHATPVIPNDEYFDRQWALLNDGLYADGTPGADIKATTAWGITKGDKDLVVAVIDTGIDYTHSELVGKIWINPLEVPNNGVDDDNNGYIDDIRGWDFTTCTGSKLPDNDPWDDIGHGTHVAGTIAASPDNFEGVAGLMWEGQVMALKIFTSGCEGAVVSEIIDAYDYAVMNGALIMNASFGGPGFSNSEYLALNAANNAGVLLVASAGNDGSNNDLYPQYPSSYDLANIIGVAATNPDDMRASFSNFGIESVDVAAPGVDILSTQPPFLSAAICAQSSFVNYDFCSGTSMSAPHVAGLAGLLYSHYTNFGVPQVKGTILRYVELLPSLEGWIKQGGRIDAYKALSSLLEPTSLTATTTSAPSISLSWMDNARGEDGYKIERSVSGGAFMEIADNLDADSEAFLDTNIFKANTYTYRVIAYNDIPAESLPSATAIVPSAPANLTATAISESQIKLSWSDSINETGYRIERKKTDEDTFSLLSEDGFSEIKTVPANVTSTIDHGLFKGTYTYRVLAFTPTGTSGYSNEASAQTSWLRSGGGGCSIGSRQNTPTSLINGAIMLLPLVFIAVLRLRRSRNLRNNL
jgi:subtilisin family serine protease